jgi:starch-binding outer membrane protein, SusD/RagB family
MKRIIKLLSITVLLGSLLMIYSCSEEFLTKEPPGVAAGSVMETPDGVEALLVAAYERIQGQDMFGGCLASEWTYSGGCSDDAYKGTSAGDQSNFNLLERYEALPNNPYLKARWADAYDGVARANVVLEFLWTVQAGTNKLPDARAKQIEGEAKFLRAWFHMELNRIFEKIPYILTQTELGTVKPEEVPNTDAGWDKIEADLQFAIDNLPTTKIKNEVGRIDKYIAQAVKAYALLTQKKYSAAKPLLDAVIAKPGLVLVPNIEYNYDMTHENNSESIFELQCSTTASSASNVMGSGCNFCQKGAASCGGWGFYQPSQNLFEAFQTTAAGLPVLDVAARDPLVSDMGKSGSDVFVPTNHLLDPRVDFIIARRGVDYLGWGIFPGSDWIREPANGGPYMSKIFMHRKDEQALNLNGSGFSNGKNYRIIRLANVLLWRAECAVEDNQLDVAMGLVNQVRNRAKASPTVMGLCTSYTNLLSNPVVDYTKPAANYKIEPYPVGSPAFATQTEARKAVQNEIRLESATGPWRFFDLRRWGILATTLNAYIAQDITFRVFMQGATFNANEDDYWPLPQDQIDLQKGILVQDASY